MERMKTSMGLMSPRSAPAEIRVCAPMYDFREVAEWWKEREASERTSAPYAVRRLFAQVEEVVERAEVHFVSRAPDPLAEEE